MFRAKWVTLVLLLTLAVITGRPASASEIVPIQIVPAVLHLPGPDEPPLYTGIEFAKTPILPGNLCEARCLTDFRDLDALLDACMAGCVCEI